MKRIFAVIFAMFLGILALTPVMPQPAYAEGEGCVNTFLGLRPWYQGLVDDSCNVKEDMVKDNLPQFIWTIVLNITSDLFVIAGVTALGFIIWGGFNYIMSNGEPVQVARAKKTIAQAIIGLIISIAASVIANTIINVLLAARGA